MAVSMEKFLLQKVLGFINMGSVFRTLANMKSRAQSPFFIFEGKTYTYGQTHEQACRYARLFCRYKDRLVKEGRLRAEDQLPVGVYMDNCPEYVFAFFGAAMSGAAIIGVNTGFRGETLANVVNRAECGLMITDPAAFEEVVRMEESIKPFKMDDVFVVGEDASGAKDIEQALSDPEVTAVRDFPSRIDNFSLQIVIYTSGTTGEPKGVPCTQAKLLGAAGLTWYRLRLGREDRGYICMPMFHSNAWFIGILPLMLGGASFVLKRKFSASAFEQDVLDHGVTYLNYVGQPINYILVALEKKYGSPEAVEKALAGHPRNRFRIAHGNGASPVDRRKLLRYFNMDHIYELYGSTEAPINSVNQPGDPIESLGKISSKKVVILNDRGEECAPGVVDDSGRLVNYDEAVGEICKYTPKDNVIFSGYFKNEEATGKKFRDGVYHSGDLGHMRIINGNRYLYFNGRTDDWIRKDGENFSAENVLDYMLKMPGVQLAAAYGAPCEVADEKVMVALQMAEGQTFDPEKSFAWCMEQQQGGGMDPKWMPDYIRIVQGFELTHQTHKIKSKELKRQHFNIEKFPDMEVYFRQRGDNAYKPLTPEAWEEIKKGFDQMDRTNFLYVGL